MSSDLEPVLPLVTCDWCGRQFHATPDAFVEAGVQAEPEPGDEWKGEPPTSSRDDYTQEELDQIKSDFQLDDQQLDELLATGRVEGLPAVVCLPCQDAGQARPKASPHE